MALQRVSYKGIRAFIPNAEDLNLARQNLAGVRSYLLQLESLGFSSGLVYDDAVIEADEALTYVEDIVSALGGNGGGGRI